MNENLPKRGMAIKTTSGEEEDHSGDNPALSHVIERNIRTIIRLRQKAARKRSVQDRIADSITSFSGRTLFAYAHIVWFVAWILLNTGQLGVVAFDPFPYGLLTMIVSLEAIFLSTFVLISQNRPSLYSRVAKILFVLPPFRCDFERFPRTASQNRAI